MCSSDGCLTEEGRVKVSTCVITYRRVEQLSGLQRQNEDLLYNYILIDILFVHLQYMIMLSDICPYRCDSEIYI